MLPGAGGAAGGGGALGHVRAAARANFFLGLALAAMALVVATSYHPSNLHVHTQSQIGHAAVPAAYAGETQQQECAATEADALDLRKTALMLVLSGLAQAMIAAAADVALAGSGGFLGSALFFGALNVYSICYVVHGVAVVAGGHCAAGYLYLPYFVIAMCYAGLLAVSLAVTICGQPHVESGLVIVSPVKDKRSNAWAFLKPFKLGMWAVIDAFFLFVGAIVWVLERCFNSEF